jgi:ribonuclease Z
MHWQAVVLTGRSADTRPAIVVTFDSAKYVFGAAEGTSRSYPESRLRFARTRAIFCERTDIRKMGGLSGALCLSDMGFCHLNNFSRHDHGRG